MECWAKAVVATSRVQAADILVQLQSLDCGPGISVSIVTDYGLDGPGIESRWSEIFRPSRPALGPTHPPVQWVPFFFPGRAADHSPSSSAAVMEE